MAKPDSCEKSTIPNLTFEVSELSYWPDEYDLIFHNYECVGRASPMDCREATAQVWEKESDLLYSDVIEKVEGNKYYINNKYDYPIVVSLRVTRYWPNSTTS